eukprot:1162072-Pelagomonas_calceolata.AAC.6
MTELGVEHLLARSGYRPWYFRSTALVGGYVFNVSLVFQVGGSTGSMDMATERNHSQLVMLTNLLFASIQAASNRLKRKMLIEAVKCSEAKHACHVLRGESARCNCATKYCHKRQQCALSLDRFLKKYPQIHATLRKRGRPHTSLHRQFQQQYGTSI